MSAIVADTLKPGAKVQQSGIYDVRHDPAHQMSHQVTCVSGEAFPTVPRMPRTVLGSA